MYLCSSTKIFIKLILIEIYYIFQYRDKLEEIKRIRSKLRESGCELPPLKPDNAHFDSNCITPVSEERERDLVDIYVYSQPLTCTILFCYRVHHSWLILQYVYNITYMIE